MRAKVMNRRLRIKCWVDIFSDAVGAEKMVRYYAVVLRFQAAYATVVEEELLYWEDVSGGSGCRVCSLIALSI